MYLGSPGCGGVSYMDFLPLHDKRTGCRVCEMSSHWIFVCLCVTVNLLRWTKYSATNKRWINVALDRSSVELASSYSWITVGNNVQFNLIESSIIVDLLFIDGGGSGCRKHQSKEECLRDRRPSNCHLAWPRWVVSSHWREECGARVCDTCRWSWRLARS